MLSKVKKQIRGDACQKEDFIAFHLIFFNYFSLLCKASQCEASVWTSFPRFIQGELSVPTQESRQDR